MSFWTLGVFLGGGACIVRIIVLWGIYWAPVLMETTMYCDQGSVGCGSVPRDTSGGGGLLEVHVTVALLTMLLLRNFN